MGLFYKSAFAFLLLGVSAYGIRPTGHPTYFGNLGHYYNSQPVQPRYPDPYFYPNYQPPPHRYYYDPYFGSYRYNYWAAPGYYHPYRAPYYNPYYHRNPYDPYGGYRR